MGKRLHLLRLGLRVLRRELDGWLRGLSRSAVFQAAGPLWHGPRFLLVCLLILSDLTCCLGKLGIYWRDLLWERVRLLAHRLHLRRDHDRGGDVLGRLYESLRVILRRLPEVIVELLVIREEDRVVEPEITLHLHGVDHLLHVLVQVGAHRPDADAAIGGTQGQELTIVGERRL